MKEAGRILIAGTGSGCGKTTLVCGLLACLKRRGVRVQALKCGPDYLDPLMHKRVLGIPSGNLDSFFAPEETLQALLASRKTDVCVLEGVMGYYDGIGMTERASTFEVAAKTRTPAVLVVDAAGKAASALAVLKGFQDYREENNLAGVIFNRMPKPLYEQAAVQVQKWGLMPLGYVPGQTLFSMKSRYLGLAAEEEIPDWQERIDAFARLLEQTVDLDGLLSLASRAKRLTAKMQAASEGCFPDGRGPVIGVARDEAFSFLYEDNLRYLKEQGCELRYFSPIRDPNLPDELDALFLCGGYPERYAAALSANAAMREQVRKAIQSGLPCIAECGGFLYLHRELEDAAGCCYPMAGVFEGRAYNGGRLERFGYVTVTAKADGLLLQKGDSFRAHEFHYWKSDCAGADFWSAKASGAGGWETGHHGLTLYAGFPHLYFYGNEKAANRFLQAAFCYRRQKRGITHGKEER